MGKFRIGQKKLSIKVTLQFTRTMKIAASILVLKLSHVIGASYGMNGRDVGSYLKLGGQVLIWGGAQYAPPPPVEIGLSDLSKPGRAISTLPPLKK